MTSKISRLVLVALITLASALLTDPALGQNEQSGDNSSSTDQGGESASGDAVAGQVTGVVSSGDTALDATNRSEDVDVSSGDASAGNNSDAFVGQLSTDDTVTGDTDFTGTLAVNSQVGDNELDSTQAAEAASGDAVGGQVIGVVTSAGGSADVVAANTSEDVDADTGDATSFNDLFDSFVGQLSASNDLTVTVVAGGEATGTAAVNVQDGDNTLESSQASEAASGDAVGGQVIGVVSAGDTSIDATNASTDVDIETGDAASSNSIDPFVGQAVIDDDVTVVVDDAAASFTGTVAANAQDGDNELDSIQTAQAASGDGVGGQVIGAVTSSGGSADIVAANTSDDVDVETGDAGSANAIDTAFTGQQSVVDSLGVEVDGGSDLSGTVAANAQDGDNQTDSAQAAEASSGDGVGGQVIGVVSAGDTSVDATNASTDVDIETGDASSQDLLNSLTGQQSVVNDVTADIDGDSDFSGTLAANVQVGDNELDSTQAADAVSGDGVGGQVIGAVTSSGGSADIVAANTSEDVDVETGDAGSTNANDGPFTGQFAVDITLVGTVVGGSDFSGTIAANVQDGDNQTDALQAAQAATGDGVGGQVIGVVSAGDTSVDATNASEDVDVDTGDAATTNLLDSDVGQLATGSTLTVTLEDSEFADTVAANILIGDTELSTDQAAVASSGDAVAGQVAGVVTSAGGSADLVLANTSEDVDAETGGSFFGNEDVEFVGQQTVTAV